MTSARGATRTDPGFAADPSNAPAEADELRHLIGELRARYGCGILVIEHNMALVMNLCDRIQVLDSGRTIATGTAAAIRNDANVRRAYLGSTVLQ